MFDFIKRWFRKADDVYDLDEQFDEQIPYDGAVIIYQALAWDCQLCDSHNYVDYVTMEPDENHAAEIREHNEQQDSAVAQVGREELTRVPYTVQCQYCRHVFAVGNHFSEWQQ